MAYYLRMRSHVHVAVDHVDTSVWTSERSEGECPYSPGDVLKRDGVLWDVAEIEQESTAVGVVCERHLYREPAAVEEARLRGYRLFVKDERDGTFSGKTALLRHGGWVKTRSHAATRDDAANEALEKLLRELGSPPPAAGCP